MLQDGAKTTRKVLFSNPTMPKSQQLAKIFFEFAYWNEMNDVAFKPRAYQIASESLNALGTEVDAAWRKDGIKGLKELPGIGQNMAEKIDEFMRTGKIKEYEVMKKKFPVDIWGLSRIEGLGAKHIQDLYKNLRVKNVKDLKTAIKTKRIRVLPHWGEKSELKLAKQLNLMEVSSDRQLLGHVLPIADTLISTLKKIPGVNRCVYAGSLRRRQETIGDIDLIATSDDPEKIMEAFVNSYLVRTVHEQGKTRSSVRLTTGMDADLRVVPDKVFGATLQYFTGDKKHNVMLREYALSKGYTLNEYGLYKLRRKTKDQEKTGHEAGRLVVCETEEEIYQTLGMDTPQPEIRVGADELEAALAHNLPDLIPYGSVRGDLQTQSDWTDGATSIEELAQAAKKLGLEYIAITDHTKSLAFLHGLDDKRVMEQGKTIDKINAMLKGFTILKGTECDIRKNGDLDLAEDTRRKLQWVGVSIHSNFKLSHADQTKRIIKAISQKYVDCLFHPTCRIIDKREPMDFDLDEVLAAAKSNDVALEINCFPERSDLRDLHVRAAVRAGVKLAINTDAHHPDHFYFLPLGEAIARRGWATKDDVLNTKNVKHILEWSAKKRT